MPTSNLWVAPIVVEMAARARAKTVLDVGPGHGKFGVLLKEYAGVETVDAVELWGPYITQFGLCGIYRNVIPGDVLDIDDFSRWDLVFMSEVIEHINMDPAKQLIDRIPGQIVVSTPTKWFQSDHPIPTERHRSLWALRDFPSERVAEHSIEHGGLFVRLGAK